MVQLHSTPPMPQTELELAVYRTPFPRIDEAFVRNAITVFGIEGKLREAGSRLIVRDRTGILEIFEASGSIWWTRIDRSKSETFTPVKFPSEKEAIARANTYLKEIGLAERRAKPFSVAYSETMLEEGDSKEPIEAKVNQHVNYTFSIDGMPVWGPGAKIQVTFGSRRRIVEVLKFWRKPRKEREAVELISPNTAVKIFQNHEAFADLSAETSKVQTDQITLGYYALPPREVQGYLIPVYRFEGLVSTEHLERYEFVKHVVAVDLADPYLKDAGATFSELNNVI